MTKVTTGQHNVTKVTTSMLLLTRGRLRHGEVGPAISSRTNVCLLESGTDGNERNKHFYSKAGTSQGTSTEVKTEVHVKLHSPQ